MVYLTLNIYFQLTKDCVKRAFEFADKVNNNYLAVVIKTRSKVRMCVFYKIMYEDNYGHLAASKIGYGCTVAFLSGM